MWRSFYSVIHFFTVRPVIHIVHYFIQCGSKFSSDTFFQIWPLFTTVNHLSGVTHFHNVTPFSKCHLFLKRDPFYLWLISQFYPFFSKRNLFFTLWSTFPNVTYFSQSDPFFTVWFIFPSMTLFYSETYLFKVSPIFHSVTCFLQRNPFFEKYFIFHSVTHSKCNSFLTVWSIFFKIWLIFLYCDTFLQMWTSFYSVTCFSKPIKQSNFPWHFCATQIMSAIQPTPFSTCRWTQKFGNWQAFSWSAW